MVRDKDPVCYLLCISSFPNTALLLLWSLDSIFLTICSYMPILVTSILQMKRIEKRSGLVSVIYWEYTASWCGRNKNRNIGRLVTFMSSIEKEGRQVMGLGYQASRSAGTDSIFSCKVPLPKCSTHF